ncbi:MAG: hypothetical protein NC321_04045 [Clostridium sp.]|nr:hypothetical protein [Clostridium sp.]
MTNVNQIILLSSESNQIEPINFNQIYSLPAEYIPQAISMSQVFQKAIISTKMDGTECLKFDFNKAKDIINQHSEMAIVGLINQTVSQNSAQVSVMVDKVIELLKNVLTVTLTDQQKESYEKAISSAFQGLKEQSESAWIFWQHSESHKTTYQYNIFFAIKNEQTGNVMLGLPVSLTITVDLEKEKVLGITVKDKHNYSVNVQAIQVVEPLRS